MRIVRELYRVNRQMQKPKFEDVEDKIERKIKQMGCGYKLKRGRGKGTRTQRKKDQTQKEEEKEQKVRLCV